MVTIVDRVYSACPHPGRDEFLPMANLPQRCHFDLEKTSGSKMDVV